MFSSNQILCISGDINHENNLKNALQFALEKHGNYSLMKQGKNYTKTDETTLKFQDFA